MDQTQSNPLLDSLRQERATSGGTPSVVTANPINTPLPNNGSLSGSLESEAKKSYEQSHPDPNAPMAWSDVESQAAANFIPSAGKAAYGMVEPFFPSNLPQTGQAVKDIGQGLYSKAQGVAADYGLAKPQNTEEKEKNEATVNAIGDFYKNRYGTMAGFQHALAQDPAGVLLDASVPLTLGEGALARAPGLVGRVAGKGILAAATNPLTAPIMAAKAGLGAAKAIPVAGDIVSGLAKIPSAATEAFTGVSNKSLGEAFQAGREGELLSGDTAFTGQMRGTAPRTAIVDEYRAAVNDAANERSQDYLSGMQSLRKGRGAPLNDIVQSGIDLLNATSHSTENYAVAQKVGQAIVDFQNGKIGPAYTFTPGQHTLHELDLLKRGIREIAKDPNLPGGYIAMDTANKVKDTISKIDPKYADIMEQYATASDELSDANRLFGNTRMTPERQLQKILSSKNNVTKQTLLDQISKRRPDLAKMLAGQELSEGPSLGFSDVLGGGSLGLGSYALGNNPYLATAIGLSTVPLKTPRFLGEAAYYAGKGSKFLPAASAAGELSQLEDANKPPAPPSQSQNPFTSAREKKYGEVIQRASGGRTIKNPKTKANQLINMVDRIKKEQGNKTKPLLNLDDTTVAKALAIANRGI